MADIEFIDNSVVVKRQLNDAIGKFLIEASSELVSQVARNSRVDQGQLKGSWKANIDESTNTATIGSELENAIWEEFGTGEHALQGNGRKGGWKYQDRKGDWHFTRGKTPSRAFFKAYTTAKPKIIRRAEQVIGAKMK